MAGKKFPGSGFGPSGVWIDAVLRVTWRPLQKLDEMYRFPVGAGLDLRSTAEPIGDDGHVCGNVPECGEKAELAHGYGCAEVFRLVPE